MNARVFRSLDRSDNTEPESGAICIGMVKATGQSTDLAPELAAQLLAGAKQAISDAIRGPEPSPFGPQQPAPAGATNADHLRRFSAEPSELA